MSFKEIFTLFITGSPIKRKEWKGFWRSTEDGVYIFKKDGTYFQIGDSSNMVTTLAHTIINDWEIATKENCSAEAGEYI